MSKIWLLMFGPVFVLIISIVGLFAMQTSVPVYQETFRPQYHFSPPEKWMNDPNGLVYFDGEYHLFYQYHPYDVIWGPMHWGHAVSTDLVHWENLPIALEPDDNGTIFSGSAVIDVNNTAGFGANAMVAIYSYNTQTQGVAYSTDRGRTWTKYEGNPIMPALATPDFRDPKVFWHEESGQWVMVIAAGREAQFYTSPNLLDWTFASSFAAGHIVATWEVPDIFPLDIDGETKWVLLVSVGAYAPAGGSGIQYFIGDFDGQTFTNDNPTGTTLWLDYGADNYAGTTWNDEPDGERIYIGWLNNWTYANNIPTSTWRGATTLPRTLRLVNTAEGVRLAQAPVAALESLRTPLGTWDDLTISSTEQVIDGVTGRTLEIIAEIEPGEAERWGLKVQRSDETGTRIVYSPARSSLLIGRGDTTSAGAINRFSPAFGAPLDLNGETLRLHIFVDESSVEVFAQDGLVALTAQTFVEPPADGLSFFADNGEITVKHLEVYALDSIWSAPE
ncbi:MAG: glycoside hydrolase family 32 protein [Chloroflexi bacterium]|nr:glycoside hydrolase family 32 protein [Chloroflexota bacterium]